MRLRAPAAMTAKENDMRLHHRLRSAVASLFPVIAAVVLSACVQSKTPLLTATKPLLGDQFQLNRYEDFTDGKADSVKLSVFRWNGTRLHACNSSYRS